MPTHIEYTTVTGYFLQDDPATEPHGFDYVSSYHLPYLNATITVTNTSQTTTNFGLIDRPYEKDASFDADKKKTPWQRFENEVARLNHESPKNTFYKVFFMGRHGEGYHNVAEAFYGTEAWDVRLPSLGPPNIQTEM